MEKNKANIFFYLLFFQIFTYGFASFAHKSPRCASGSGRCMPDEPCWPSQDQWNALNESVQGRLSIPQFTFQSCLDSTPEEEASCQRSLEQLGEDPLWIEQFPGGSESTGQVNAWTFRPSTYAIEARDENDIVQAVNFAREFNLRLVVKGTGIKEICR